MQTRSHINQWEAIGRASVESWKNQNLFKKSRAEILGLPIFPPPKNVGPLTFTFFTRAKELFVMMFHTICVTKRKTTSNQADSVDYGLTDYILL